LPPRALAFAVAGALTIAWSSILVEWADVSPETAAVFRCVYAVPLLGLLAYREDQKLGARDPRSRRLAAVAGVFFAADLIFWHHAIQDVGAGLATVLGNLQVAFVPLVAWAVLSEHPSRRVLATLPVVLIGVVLVSGALEDSAFGDNPARGAVFGLLTGIAYAGFLLTLRAGSADLRRPAGPLFDATLVSAVAAAAAGAAMGRVDFTPAWPEHGFLVLLALSSQVLGWMLISTSLPRLPAAVTSILLTIQPVGSMVLGALLLDESATALQLLGVVAILTGLVAVASSRRPAPAAAASSPRPAA
jgi:drug/metabolite transporter (DMT)-like permease